MDILLLLFLGKPLWMWLLFLSPGLGLVVFDPAFLKRSGLKAVRAAPLSKQGAQ